MKMSNETEQTVLSPEEEAEIARKKEQTRLRRNMCIDLAMEHMGWTREQAVEHLKKARELTGISYKEYRRFFFFEIPENEQEERYAEIRLGQDFRKSRRSNEKEKYVANIMKYTGWTEKETRRRMDASRGICGATYKDYYAFRFWEIDESEQTKYFTQKRSNQLSHQYDTNPLSMDILLNKELSCRFFSKYMNRAWCINKKVSLAEFKKVFAASEKVVYKPLDGNGGHGVEVFKLKETGFEAAYEKVKTYPRGVLEDYVVQHPAMSSLAPGSVNTIRIVTMAYNDGSQVVADGEYPVDIAYAAVRIGSGTSVVDNFTEGGFVVGVDLATGTIATAGVTIEGTPYENHPMTGTKFRGFEIPFFNEAIAMVKEAGKKVGGYTGWDVAITEKGPVLIEANTMPGNRILQMPYVCDRIGRMCVMEKYYNEAPIGMEEKKKPVKKAAAVPCVSVQVNNNSVLGNERLSAFEVKAPDYDYVSRSSVGLEYAEFDPARYVKHDGQWFKFPVKEAASAKLMFTGDITCFEKQFEEASVEGGYDFTYEFDKIRSVFAQADLVVGNLETMIFPGAPYRTEKYVSEQNYHCNAPIEFLDALRKAGFDMLTNANNHCLDTGAVGIGETIDYVNRFGFIQTGTFKTDKKKFEIINVNGFKVAITAFATNFNNKLNNLTKEGAKFLLNEYSAEKASALLADAKAAGAEYVIASIHWGDENKTAANNKQQEMAKEMAEAGYNCIIGSHPHVLQQFEWIDGKDGKVPVFYSLGNFISHNANNNKARSLVAVLDLSRVHGRVKADVTYVPIFTSNNYGDQKYVVLPLSLKTVSVKNRKKIDRIADVVGREIAADQSVKYKDYREKKSEPEKKVKTELPDLKKITEYPFTYESSKYRYEIHKDHAVLLGAGEDVSNRSYSVDPSVLDLPVTALAEGAFAGDIHIKKINFGRVLRKVPAGAFKGCSEMEGFQVGVRVNEICAEAFADCTSLTAACMKAGVKRIGSRAFANCTALRTAKLPENVTYIADDAFENCPRVTIYCEKGSYAESYAITHEISYVNMDLK